MRLNPKASAAAGAVIFGVGLFLLTFWLMAFGDPEAGTGELIGQVYIGYRVSVVGAFLGLFYGAIDGVFGGFFFAIVYNWVDRRFGGLGETKQV